MTGGTVTDDVDGWVFFTFDGLGDLCYGILVWVEDGGFDAFFDARNQGLALWMSEQMKAISLIVCSIGRILLYLKQFSA